MLSRKRDDIQHIAGDWRRERRQERIAPERDESNIRNGVLGDYDRCYRIARPLDKATEGRERTKTAIGCRLSGKTGVISRATWGDGVYFLTKRRPEGFEPSPPRAPRRGASHSDYARETGQRRERSSRTKRQNHRAPGSRWHSCVLRLSRLFP